MGMAGPIATPTGHRMITNTDLLTLAQWLSPSYPVGSFAYSHGLETVLANSDITDAAQLQVWIAEVLEFGSGRNDALLLAAAYLAENPAETDALARALAPSQERLLEMEAQGQAFAEVTRTVWQMDLPDLAYPVAVGHAARMRDIPVEAVSALFLQAFAATLASVGQRLIPIGQTDAQRLVHNLAPLCQRIAVETQQGDLTHLGASAFLADVASMRHETLYSRIFRS